MSLVLSLVVACCVARSAAQVSYPYTQILSYQPTNDMTNYLAIDKDLKAMSDAASVFNFTEAAFWYEVGGNSIKTDGSVRTLAGFSTNAAKMLGTLPFNAFYDYYNANALYSDAYVEDALHATGQFAFQASPIVVQSSGSEGSVKGAAGGMMMYTIRELHEADSDKEEGIVGAHVDEAVSFYTGSIAADSKGSSVGVAQFALAEKRAADFGTQVSGSSYFKSLVNTKVFDLFNQLNAVHQDSSSTNNEIHVAMTNALISQMFVPYLQAVLKYAYWVSVSNSEEQRAELGAFCYYFVPYLAYYDSDAGTTLQANCDMSVEPMLVNTFAELKSAIEAAYPAMDYTCAQIGGLVHPFNGGYYTGAEPCADDSTATITTTTSSSSSSSGNDNGPSGAAAAAIALAVFIATVATGGLIYYCMHKPSDGAKHVELEEEVRSEMASAV